MDTEVFVQNIKKYCDIKGIKPTIACKESGAGKDLINQIERKGSIPSVEKVKLLADYLGVTTSELLGEDLPTAGREHLMAAFWGGDQELTEADKAAMWDDVAHFAQFLAEKKKQEKRNG